MSQCSGPNESKYLAISSPSEAVSASIHMIHNRSGMDDMD